MGVRAKRANSRLASGISQCQSAKAKTFERASFSALRAPVQGGSRENWFFCRNSPRLRPGSWPAPQLCQQPWLHLSFLPIQRYAEIDPDPGVIGKEFKRLLPLALCASPVTRTLKGLSCLVMPAYLRSLLLLSGLRDD